MNRDGLTRDIREAARASFSALLAQHGDEHFYAFALYTDEDCYTVVPAANSLERHQAAMARKEDVDPGTIACYKWSSAEWAFECFAADPFDPVCDQLADACAAVSGDAAAFAAFKADVHAAMTEALRQLDAEGFFDEHRAGAVLFITSSGGDEALAMEDASAKALNPPQGLAEFLGRFGTRR